VEKAGARERQSGRVNVRCRYLLKEVTNEAASTASSRVEGQSRSHVHLQENEAPVKRAPRASGFEIRIAVNSGRHNPPPRTITESVTPTQDAAYVPLYAMIQPANDAAPGSRFFDGASATSTHQKNSRTDFIRRSACRWWPKDDPPGRCGIDTAPKFEIVIYQLSTRIRKCF
jgi:hypothetical protein